MIKYNGYRIMVVLGVLLWFSETAYFGWNDTPHSNLEKMLDIISELLIVWGILGDLASNLTIQKHTNTNITTKKTVIQQASPKKENVNE